MISANMSNEKQIQSRYSTHRTARNAKQKENLLAMNFKGLNLDSILQRLEDPAIEPGFVDPRHSLVLWARPPPHIQKLVSEIQQRLKRLAPSTSISFSYCDRRFFMIAEYFFKQEWILGFTMSAIVVPFL
jgi:hypothetical protein